MMYMHYGVHVHMCVLAVLGIKPTAYYYLTFEIT